MLCKLHKCIVRFVVNMPQGGLKKCRGEGAAVVTA